MTFANRKHKITHKKKLKQGIKTFKSEPKRKLSMNNLRLFLKTEKHIKTDRSLVKQFCQILKRNDSFYMKSIMHVILNDSEHFNCQENFGRIKWAFQFLILIS